MKECIHYCPQCNKYVQYTIRKNLMQRYKGIEVNTVENIGVCNECGEELLVMELEVDNLNRLYRKYEEITGIKIKSPLKALYIKGLRTLKTR